MQGFLQFCSRGEVTRLDVDALNERMAVKGRERLRHSMKPEEGLACVFWCDDVVADAAAAKRAAWAAVARQHGAHTILALCRGSRAVAGTL